MKMLDRQEYDDLMSYLKPVFKKIWAHENDERQKVGKSLDAFQFGFPINNIWLYLVSIQPLFWRFERYDFLNSMSQS